MSTGAPVLPFKQSGDDRRVGRVGKGKCPDHEEEVNPLCGQPQMCNVDGRAGITI